MGPCGTFFLCIGVRHSIKPVYFSNSNVNFEGSINCNSDNVVAFYTTQEQAGPAWDVLHVSAGLLPISELGK